jgi:O-antigen ligase
MKPFLSSSNDSLQRPHTSGEPLTIDSFFVTCLFLLIGVFAFLAFYNRGAFEAEEGYRRGGLLILSNTLILAYVIHVKIFGLWQPSTMLRVLGIWAIWVSMLSLHDLSYGSREVLKSWMEMLYCPLFFFAFYYLTIRNSGIERKTTRFFICMVVFNSILFFFVAQYQSAIRVSSGVTQLNDIYYILLLLPWAMLVRRRLFRNLLLLLIAMVVFSSFKRTAIIAMTTSLFLFFLAEMRISSLPVFKVRVFVSFAVVIGGFWGLFTIVEDRSDNYISTRMLAMTEDKGSGRMDVYQSAIQVLSDRSLFEWAIGAGHNGFRKDAVHIGSRGQALSAHNDWLEVLYNLGLPGFVLFLIMNIILLKRMNRMNRERSVYGSSMLVSYAIFFLMTMTSHLVLYPTYYSYLMAYWGTVFAIHDKAGTAISGVAGTRSGY